MIWSYKRIKLRNVTNFSMEKVHCCYFDEGNLPIIDVTNLQNYNKALLLLVRLFSGATASSNLPTTYSSVYIILCQGKITVRDSTWDLLSRYTLLQGHNTTYDVQPPYLVF